VQAHHAIAAHSAGAHHTQAIVGQFNRLHCQPPLIASP
jgi:hypothetical protein